MRTLITRTRALVCTTSDGKVRVYIDNGRPESVDREFSFTERWFPQTNPRICEVEIHVVKAPPAQYSPEEETFE